MTPLVGLLLGLSARLRWVHPWGTRRQGLGLTAALVNFSSTMHPDDPAGPLMEGSLAPSAGPIDPPSMAP